MGKKKDRKERKQTGSQKTALKTEKKNEKKTKKMLQERGEVWPCLYCCAWTIRTLDYSIQSNSMSITEAGQGPLFPSQSKNLKYTNANKLTEIM